MAPDIVGELSTLRLWLVVPRSLAYAGEDLGRVRRFLKDKVPLDGSVVPQIFWTELRERLIRVVCANDLTKKWVEAQIAASGQGWMAGKKKYLPATLKKIYLSNKTGLDP